jgi:hypothetical protein
MTTSTYTAECWLRRAKDARAHAEETSDPRAKRQLMEIAAAYEQMAQLAGQPNGNTTDDKGSP